MYLCVTLWSEGGGLLLGISGAYHGKVEPWSSSPPTLVSALQPWNNITQCNKHLTSFRSNKTTTPVFHQPSHQSFSHSSDLLRPELQYCADLSRHIIYSPYNTPASLLMTYTINICKPRPSCKSRLTGKCERVHKTTCIRDDERLPLVRENID